MTKQFDMDEDRNGTLTHDADNNYYNENRLIGVCESPLIS